MCIIDKKVEKLSIFQQKLAKCFLNHIEKNKESFKLSHNPIITTYGDVSRELYKHSQGSRCLRIPAGYVSTFCLQHDLPPISAIMCNASGTPGLGFDEMYNFSDKTKHKITSKNREVLIKKIQEEVYNNNDWSLLEAQITDI